MAVKADKDITPLDMEAKNLILFGESQENLILDSVAKSNKVPVMVTNGTVNIGEKKYDLKGRGFIAIYPNPLTRPEATRSIVIYAGLNYGQTLSINHKLDLLPDFLLYTNEADTDHTGTNKPVVAGFFDGQWRLNPETTWEFNP